MTLWSPRTGPADSRGIALGPERPNGTTDLETSAVVGVTVQDADAGDTNTMVETLITAAEQVEAVRPAGGGLAEVVGDKNYHQRDRGCVGGAAAPQLRVRAGQRAAPVATATPTAYRHRASRRLYRTG